MSDLYAACDCDDLMTTPVESNWTPVLYTRDGAEATRYCSILEEASIPALAGDAIMTAGCGRRLTLSLPVLVPQSCHERASEILSSLEATLSDDDELCDDDEEEDEDDEEEEDDDDFLDDDPEDDLDDEEEDDLLDDEGDD